MPIGLVTIHVEVDGSSKRRHSGKICQYMKRFRRWMHRFERWKIKVGLLTIPWNVVIWTVCGVFVSVYKTVAVVVVTGTWFSTAIQTFINNAAEMANYPTASVSRHSPSLPVSSFLKIKRKTIKSKSEYASRASPNGPLNIYVADMPWKNMINWKQCLGLIQLQSANDSQDNVGAT